MNGNITIIRDRYQITIPAALRKFSSWIKPNGIIKITLVSKEKVVLEPYKKAASVNLSKTWKVFEGVQRQGKKFSSTNFLMRDREGH